MTGTESQCQDQGGESTFCHAISSEASNTLLIDNDTPIVLPNPMCLPRNSVNCCNDILGLEQGVRLPEGLNFVNFWLAYQSFEQDTKGSIEVGKLADFAILFAKPLTTDPMTIRDIEALEMIKKGKRLIKRRRST